jgi:hypothetical protein
MLFKLDVWYLRYTSHVSDLSALGSGGRYTQHVVQIRSTIRPHVHHWVLASKSVRRLVREGIEERTTGEAGNTLQEIVVPADCRGCGATEWSRTFHVRFHATMIANCILDEESRLLLLTEVQFANI